MANVPDIRGKQVGVFGKKGMGKSYFLGWVMEKISGNYACFDPMREHTDIKENDLVVRPTERRGEEAIFQLKEFVEAVVNNRHVFDYIIVDEINRFHSKGSTLSGPVGDLCDFSAHYNMGFIFAARRPVSIHADLQELSDYMFFFRLDGVNDTRRLDSISSGLGHRVAGLNEREFIFYNGKDSEAFPPIPERVHHNKGI